MKSYIFEDIIVDIDDILPDPNKKSEPEGKKAWDSGTKENIWRGVNPKDIWTADPINGKEEFEPEVATGDDDDPHDGGNEGHGFDDIF